MRECRICLETRTSAMWVTCRFVCWYAPCSNSLMLSTLLFVRRWVHRECVKKMTVSCAQHFNLRWDLYVVLLMDIDRRLCWTFCSRHVVQQSKTVATGLHVCRCNVERGIRRTIFNYLALSVGFRRFSGRISSFWIEYWKKQVTFEASLSVQFLELIS